MSETIDDKSREINEYANDRAKVAVEAAIKEALTKLGQPDLNIRIEYPPPGIDADLAIPCFPYAKAFRKAPDKISQEIADNVEIQKGGFIAKVESNKGYLNVFLNNEKIATEIFSDFTLYGENYGNSSEGNGKNVVIDLSSPNIAKPFSVGNIRSTIIGHSIYNIFESQGYKTIGINHLGDWGTQFGKLIYAYEQWGDSEKILKNPIKELLALYVRFHQEVQKEKAAGSEPENGEALAEIPDEDDETGGGGSPMEEEARKRFRMLEKGDPEMTRIWQWFVDVSMEDFNRIYARLDVKFDFIQGESFYRDKTQEVLTLVQDKGISNRDSDGALLVRLEDYGIDTPLLLQKSDGATLYATRELAELIYRTRTFSPHMILYVVGSEQKLHFRQCFQVLKMLGFDTECHHVDFGMISLKEGKMSTRAGRVIFFEDVLEEARNRVQKILEEKRPDLSPEEKDKISEVVGVGAIKFNDLSQNRIKNIVFDWDKMLSFDGDTAPYLQYSYARVRSILRKADDEPGLLPAMLKEKEEISLIKKLARFPEAIRQAVQGFAPQQVAQYLLEAARVFTAFYQSVPVLKAESADLRKARLGLIQAYATVIRKGLWLLGIRVLERM